jgi:hypothetical protein
MSKTAKTSSRVHPLGIGLYLFDCMLEFHAAWGRGRKFGVMVDEV